MFKLRVNLDIERYEIETSRKVFIRLCPKAYSVAALFVCALGVDLSICTRYFMHTKIKSTQRWGSNDTSI